MKLVKAILISTIMFLQFVSCKESGTNPDNTPRIKTPREMTWTATTITSPDTTSIQVLPENLVVFSENDMWLVCWSDVARGLLWHYDGKTWTESNIVADVGGMRVNDVAGNSSSDLWTAGYSGDKIFLAHYDGMHWTRRDNMNIKGELLDMTKDPEGNIWACGRNGVILKYDKTKWIADTIKLKLSADVSYWLKSVEYYKGNIYVLASTANKITLKEKYYFLYGDINNWTIADSMTIDSPTSVIKWGYYGLFFSPSNSSSLYSYGLEGVWKYINTNWESIFSLDYQIYGMYEVNSNYILAVGPFNHFYFYDGTVWDNISNVLNVKDPTFVFQNAWSNGYETIIVGYGVVNGIQKTLVWHGK